ncbi:MAG: WYL domain-containing protein [Actinomycetota bacterium]
MRADRLVATLLLLQARGTVTAREVAAELEVSERTARRDLDALAVAGIPVYSIRGRGGGWRLVGGASTDLTGLRSVEARALVTMAAAAGQATPEFAQAIAKLTQALPEPLRDEARAVLGAMHTDDRPWGNPDSVRFEERRDEWLDPLQRAVLDRRRVELGYRHPRRGSSLRTIEPLGLVTKRGAWYLVAGTEAGRRTFRLDRISSVDVLDASFEGPEDFDLTEAWDDITRGYVERSRRFTVEAVVDDGALPDLRALGVEVIPHGPVGSGRTSATLGAWQVDVLVTQLAGAMGGVELLDPPVELTERLARVGAELVARFGRPDAAGAHR